MALSRNAVMRLKDVGRDGLRTLALFQKMASTGEDRGSPAGGQALAAVSCVEGRSWVVVGAIMVLVVAAPLLRPGVPATRAGLIPLAQLAAAPLPPTLAINPAEALLLIGGGLVATLIGALAAYKLLLIGALVVGAVGTAVMGRQVGGTAGALVAVALFLFLPLLAATLYLDGRAGLAWAWALWPWALALSGSPRARLSVRLLGALALGGLALAAGGPGRVDHVAPADLLAPRWPDNSSVATWLSLPVHQLGQATLGLALVSAWLAVTSRPAVCQGPLLSLALAAALVVSALLPGLPAFELRLMLAALLLIRTGAALPARAPDVARAPWLAGAVILIALMGYPHLAPAFHDQVPAGPPRAFFGPDRLALVAATVEAAPAPGSAVSVATTWQVLAPLDRDYTAFVHVVPVDSPVPVAQQDGLLLAGERPSSQWTVGEIIEQRATIAIPADAPPGPYRVLTGLYRADTGDRLPRWPSGDSVEVGR